MRKILLVAFLTIFSIMVFAADETLITSPATATAQSKTGSCFFRGMILRTDGTNNVTVNIYDGVGATTVRLIPTNFVVPGTDYYFGYKPPAPIKCKTGIYVTIAVAGGGTCSYQIFYSQVI